MRTFCRLISLHSKSCLVTLKQMNFLHTRRTKNCIALFTTRTSSRKEIFWKRSGGKVEESNETSGALIQLYIDEILC